MHAFRQEFSDKDIEVMHKPNNRQATRASQRTPAPSASPAFVHAANDAAPVPVLEAQVPATGDDAERLRRQCPLPSRGDGLFSEQRPGIIVVDAFCSTLGPSTHDPRPSTTSKGIAQLAAPSHSNAPDAPLNLAQRKINKWSQNLNAFGPCSPGL